jgi:hypothetical protein
MGSQGPTEVLTLGWPSFPPAAQAPGAFSEGPFLSQGFKAQPGYKAGGGREPGSGQGSKDIAGRLRQELIVYARRNPSLQKLVDSYEEWERSYRCVVAAPAGADRRRVVGAFKQDVSTRDECALRTATPVTPPMCGHRRHDSQEGGGDAPGRLQTPHAGAGQPAR